MTVLERRIDNILKAMREAKDYEMKSIWNRKLQELFKIRKDKVQKTALIHQSYDNFYILIRCQMQVY